MTAQEILEGIRDVAGEFFDLPGAVDLETEIPGDLQLDSIELVTLVAEIENRFKVCLGDFEEDEPLTVAWLVTDIERRIAARDENAGVSYV